MDHVNRCVCKLALEYGSYVWFQLDTNIYGSLCLEIRDASWWSQSCSSNSGGEVQNRSANFKSALINFKHLVFKSKFFINSSKHPNLFNLFLQCDGALTEIGTTFWLHTYVCTTCEPMPTKRALSEKLTINCCIRCSME